MMLVNHLVISFAESHNVQQKLVLLIQGDL